MKHLLKRASLSAVLTLIAISAQGTQWKQGMLQGTVPIKSAGSAAFGPYGILFVANSKSAAIHAIVTGDVTSRDLSQPIRLASLDRKLAALVGVTNKAILIQDMAVNTLSKNIYFSLSRGCGPDAVPIIARVHSSGKAELIDLRQVQHSTAELAEAPVDAEVGEGRGRSNPRMESISDIAFPEDRVLVAGLTNEEFPSILRGISFPFREVGKGTKVEIYHKAHGRFETRSPVRTFVPLQIRGEPFLLAAYTCTPLVQFPIQSIQPGAEIVGKTAELGNRNRPLDMMVYNKEEQTYLLMANSSRGIMKIPANDIASASSIESAVQGGATGGLDYETIEQRQGVDQLDLLDERHAILLVRADNGPLHLESRPLP